MRLKGKSGGGKTPKHYSLSFYFKKLCLLVYIANVPSALSYSSVQQYIAFTHNFHLECS